MLQWDIPSNWGLVRLGDVAPEVSSQVSPKNEPDTTFNYWGLDAISQGQLDEPQPNYVLGVTVSSTCVSFTPDHVLYAKLRPYLNKVIVPSVEGIGSTEWVVLAPNLSLLDRKYLGYVLRTNNFVQHMTESSAGARMPRARKDVLFDSQIPIPFPNDSVSSLEIQKRIVLRLETLLEEVKSARELQGKIEEDANLVLEAARHEVFTELAKKSSTQKFDEIAESNLGKMLSAASKTGTHSRPYLRNANVLWDAFNLSDVSEMDFEPEQRERYALRSGDLLICEGGEIGRSAVWEGQIPECYYQKALHRVRLRDPKSSPRYLMHYMAWSAKSGEIAKLKTGATIPHLTGASLKTLDVIWVDPIEQKRVVAYLDVIGSESKELQKGNQENADLITQLEQSLLSQAFRGEL